MRRPSMIARVVMVVLFVAPAVVDDAAMGEGIGERLSSVRQDGWAWQSGFHLAEVDDSVRAATVFDDGTGPALYVGGDFATAGSTVVNHLARWDGSSWSALSGPSGTAVNGEVYALAVFDDGSGPALYAGGVFTTAGGVTVNHVAKWDGTAWSALSGPSGTGMAGEGDVAVYALAVYDDGSGPALYAGGFFTTAGGVTVNHIAKWDGSDWFALSGPSGTGTGGVYPDVRSLAVFDDGTGEALYAGGKFATAGGVSVYSIAKWDGSVWSALRGPSLTGVNGDVFALAVFDDGSGPALFAGGSFYSAAGVLVNHVAKWDGSEWSPLSGPSGTGTGGPTSSVYALAGFDDGTGPALYAGGNFNTAGGVTVNRIAKWDGGGWSALSGPSGTGMSGWAVYALAVSYDGSGPALVAGGRFTTAGGVAVNGIAWWDGGGWSALSGPSGTGMNDTVRALAAYDGGMGPALYAGGYFTIAGGIPSSRVAAWSRLLFADGFESGDTSGWSLEVP